MPKYGNDDPTGRRPGRHSGPTASASSWRGTATCAAARYQPGFYTVSSHVPMGANVGATPDGRHAGAPLADGGLSPSAGRDRKGPTAVLRSVSKLDLKLASNGTLLNMKFLPDLLQGRRGPGRPSSRCCGPSAGWTSRMCSSTWSPREMLREAQATPRHYRNLVVRVAGYSAYFTELDRTLQDEIIERTAFATLG